MSFDPDRLEHSLREELAPIRSAPPEAFLRAVGARRRRVVAVRVGLLGSGLALAALVLVVGLRPRQIPNAQNDTAIRIAHATASPPGLRRLREVPPETPAAPGATEVIRVLDVRTHAGHAHGGL
ncbi:MAG: hypothetical protein JSS51_02045 [Planctomycetes bacterium]|nr:hypothetical protein [Planctomycetota bacterium]